MAKITTTAFDEVNAQNSKEPVLVMEIDGVPFVLSSAKVYTTIRYDDPDVFYDGTYVYDGLRPLSDDKQKNLIDRKGSSSTISQKLEQWDGKASVETLSIKVIDKNGLMTQVVTPGFYIPEILNAKTRIYFGYQEISFPEDYLLIFSGYINEIVNQSGSIMLTFTDPSSKRKQAVFNGSTSTTTKVISYAGGFQVDVPNNLIDLSGNQFQNDDAVTFQIENTTPPSVLPSPLVAGTKYYVVNVVGDTFKVSLTMGGSPVILTDEGSGNFFIQNYYSDIIDLSSTENLYRTITAGDGTSDPGVELFIRIGDELIQYTNANIVSGTKLSGVTRGAEGTEISEHDIGSEVDNVIKFTDKPFLIALKVMLSGWNGPWVEDLGLRGIINTDDGNVVPNSVTFEQGVDIGRIYGATIGDYLVLANSPNPVNNGTWKILDIINDGRTVTIDPGTSTLVQENPPSLGDLTTTAGFRSKYDVYPVTAGLSLVGDDVAVDNWEFLDRTFITFDFSLLVQGEESSGKTWMEENLLKPIGAYSLTQGSRISVGLTHPPLASDLSRFIEPANVTNPGAIQSRRGLNNRFFYNEISFNYAYDLIKDDFFRNFRYVDADAQNRMSQVSVLELDVKGLDDSDLSRQIMTRQAKRLIQRYHYAAETIENVSTLFKVGNTIDAGDIVVYKDPTGLLQVADTDTGTRGLTSRVMEIQERKINISSGTTTITMLSNNGFSATDRYGVFAPASSVDGTFASTTTSFRIIPSGSKLYGAAEYKKWENFEGSTIRVHNASFTQDAETTFTLDPFDPNIFHVTPALAFTPDASHTVQYAKYNQADPNINAAVKATYCHWDSTATVFSGTSQTVFTLDSGFSARYQAGQVLYVMSPDGSRFSVDVKILSVVGDVITIGPISGLDPGAGLGFIPQNGDLVQLAGFRDGGNGYRLI